MSNFDWNSFFLNMNQAVNNIGTPEVTGNVQIMQTNLDNLYRQGNIANSSNLVTLTHQRDMNNIVQTENNRLKEKKAIIDDARESQKRLIDFNNSYNQRYMFWTKITTVIIITLVVYMIFSTLEMYFPFIPGFVFDILNIITFCIGVFICYFIYLDIYRRSKMNFNELELDPPKKASPQEIQAAQNKASKSGDLLGTLNVTNCTGPECCGPNTSWDSGNAICMSGNTIVSAFTTLNDNYLNGNYSVKANSSYEFTHYSKI